VRALELLRRAEQARAEDALAGAEEQLERARKGLAAAQAGLEAHMAAGPAGSTGGGHSERLPGTRLRLEAAFARRHALETEALQRALAAQRREVSRCQQMLSRARLELAQAHGRREVVSRELARREAEVRRQSERVEEREIEERPRSR